MNVPDGMWMHPRISDVTVAAPKLQFCVLVQVKTPTLSFKRGWNDWLSLPRQQPNMIYSSLPTVFATCLETRQAVSEEGEVHQKHLLQEKAVITCVWFERQNSAYFRVHPPAHINLPYWN